MIPALSKFKVSNGLEGLVARAFLDRRDASVFYLSTRWTREAAFREGHGSEAHHQSRAGIPKGLKLDASFTELVVLEQLCN